MDKVLLFFLVEFQKKYPHLQNPVSNAPPLHWREKRVMTFKKQIHTFHSYPILPYPYIHTTPPLSSPSQLQSIPRIHPKLIRINTLQLRTTQPRQRIIRRIIQHRQRVSDITINPLQDIRGR